MKKVFLFFAVASFFVACNKPAQTETSTQADSLVVEEVTSAPADSLNADSIAPVDSVAPAM